MRGKVRTFTATKGASVVMPCVQACESITTQMADSARILMATRPFVSTSRFVARISIWHYLINRGCYFKKISFQNTSRTILPHHLSSLLRDACLRPWTGHHCLFGGLPGLRPISVSRSRMRPGTRQKVSHSSVLYQVLSEILTR